MKRLWCMAGLATLAASSACIGSTSSEPDESPEPNEPIGRLSSAITVNEAVSAGCSTASVKGLSLQIIEQMNCLVPGALSEIPALANADLSSATVIPYMQTAARDALVKALKAKPGTTMSFNSILRSLPQQYLLYRWYQAGKCGISLAASPGNSPHERGVGMDIDQYSTWRTTLEAHGFSWQGSNDPVHYTYVGSGIKDLNGKSVLAFQMLWNINNPGDKIDEDGDYGPQTEARLKLSPAGGFATPPDCNPNDPPHGVLDHAGCDTVAGWAQDPDESTKAISVHVYFGGPAGDANAKSVPTNAGIKRDDLCAPLGSCEHGFSLPSPLSLHDGNPHPVHAYGIDSEGGANAQLEASPKTLTCAPQIPAGVRRHVTSQSVMQAWLFDSFWHVMPVSDAQLAAIEDGDDVPAAPELVQADDGSPQVWLVDGAWRRHVPSPAVAQAWGFDLATVKKLPAAQVDALLEGTTVRARPVLVKASGAAVYLIDDDQSPGGAQDAGVPDSTTGTDAAASTDAAGAAGAAGQSDAGTSGKDSGAAASSGSWETSSSDSGCSVAWPSGPTSLGGAALAWIALLAMRRRRS